MPMIRLRIFVASFALLAAPAAFAQSTTAGTFAPDLWEEGAEVTVTGTRLSGDYEKERHLCFAAEAAADDLLCFENEDSISRWTQYSIVFVPPANAPPAGFVSIIVVNDEERCVPASGGQSCKVEPVQRHVVLGAYRAKPVVIDVIDQETGLTAERIAAGRTYEISGLRFGPDVQDVYVGTTTVSRNRIDSWSDLSIVFTPSTSVDGATNVSVFNSVARSKPFPIEERARVSDDPYSHLQRHLTDSNVPDAWRRSTGKGIVVAVIDSGVDTNNEEFKNRIWRNTGEIRGNGKDDDGNGYVDDTNGWDFAYDSPELTPTDPHGTSVAGIIAAAKDNGIGVAGVAPDSVIMPLIIVDADGIIDTAWVCDAIRYAVDNGADLINLSLGGPGFTTDFDPSYTDCIRYAADRDVLTIIAAGNGDALGQIQGDPRGVNLNQNPASPVCNREDPRWTLGVAALDARLNRSLFSDYGDDCIDIAALGEDVVTTTYYALADGYEYDFVTGTSFAAPVVTGAAALAWSANPELAAWQIRDLLVRTSQPVDASDIGGLVDAAAAVERALQTEPKPPLKPSVPITSPFRDVSRDDPYLRPIAWAAEQGIVGGYPDGTFQPERTVNRAEFLKIVLEAANVAPVARRSGFPDVDEDAWYGPYVRAGKAAGIIQGYPDGTFKPEQTVNVAEALKMAYFTLGIPTADARGEWYERYLRHAKENGVLRSALDPASGMRRKDVVWVVWALLAG